MVEIRTRVRFSQTPPLPLPGKPAPRETPAARTDQPVQARVWVVDPDPDSFELVCAALKGESYQVVQFKTAQDAMDQSIRRPPDLAIIEADLPDASGYALTRNLRQQEQTALLPIVMLSARAGMADKLAGFEAGIDDYVVKPFQAEELAYRVRVFITRNKAAVTTAAQTQKRGKIITIFGTKGGVGKTTLAVNLAISIYKKTHKRVALVDADFNFGDIPLHLNLTPTTTVMDLVQRIDHLEPELLQRVLIRHSSGIHVLLAPTQPEQAETVTPDNIIAIIEALSGVYDYLIVDCHPNYDDRNLQILEHSDEIMFVIRPELGVLRNMGVFMNLSVKLGLDQERIHIVLNRTGIKSGIEAPQIERSFKSKVEFRMANGGREVVTCVNRGIPLMVERPRHPLSKAIAGMAEYFVRQESKTSSGGKS